MERSEYRSLLGQLPIKSPTAEDMARLCPHLFDKDQVVDAFTNGEGYVACPPLRVRNGYHVLHYQKEWVETISRIQGTTGIKNHPARLDRAFAGRTRESYADGKPHGDVFSKNKYAYAAMKFAEASWGSDLILDDWESVVEIYVQDPTDLVTDHYHTDYPRTKAILYVALNRDFNDIINDHSKPETELFDDSISQMTLDFMVWSEIKGGRGGFSVYNCANCGAGLSLSSCTGCGHQFRDDQFRCGWNTPLSRKMVAFLRENGHVFKVDPEIAWKKEMKGYLAYHPRD